MESDSEDDEAIEFEIQVVDSLSSSSSSSSISSTSHAPSGSDSSSFRLPALVEDPPPSQNEEQAVVVTVEDETFVSEHSTIAKNSSHGTLVSDALVVNKENEIKLEQENRIAKQSSVDLQIHSTLLDQKLADVAEPNEILIRATEGLPTIVQNIEYQIETLRNPISELAECKSVSPMKSHLVYEALVPLKTTIEVCFESPEIELQVEEIEDPNEEQLEQQITTRIEAKPHEFVVRGNLEELDSEDEEKDEFPLNTQQVSLKRGHEASEHYELGEELGRGKFGYVYKCVERSTGRHFAAKFVSLRKAEDREDVLREIAIMSVLKHRRLLQLLDAFDEVRGQMCLITELIEGGELFERIVDDDFELTEQVAAKFMRQICEGVAYMHSQAIVHLDMKPENILCASRESLRVKLIDFGLARQLQPGQSLRVMFGTPDFAAPEVLAYEEVSLATDMWSLGVICYVLLSGLSPFMGDTDLETMVNVEKAVYEFDEEAFAPISEEAKDFISRLLVRNQAKRMKPDECLKHPWLKRRRPMPSSSFTTTTQITTPIHAETATFPSAATSTIAATNQDLSNRAIISEGRHLEMDAEFFDESSLMMPDEIAEPHRRQSIAGVPVKAWEEHTDNHLLAPIPERSYTLPLFISLDKRNLKRYVVRRKWHRSVHAIMALGRMGALLNRLT